MLIANKNGRKIRAMTMDEPVDQCRGVVQCGLPGCEAYMAIVEPGTRRASGNVEDGTLPRSRSRGSSNGISATLRAAVVTLLQCKS